MACIGHAFCATIAVVQTGQILFSRAIRRFKRMSTRHCRPHLASTFPAALAFVAALSGSAMALTPESPEVQQLVVKAIKYLESPKPQPLTGNASAAFPGARSLVGLCMLKYYKEDGINHPKVAEAIQAIRDALASNTEPLDVYNTGISLVFLYEADPVQYRPEMERLLAHLLSIQKGHGGWGYIGQRQKPTGDTSMTQYGVLGLWAADKSGLETPIEAWERVANWLLRTQDPGGGWGYQGNDPGSFSLVAQTEIRPSLSAAGLGSLFICTQHLGLNEPAEAEKTSIPSPLKPVGKSPRERSQNVSTRTVEEAKARAKGWFKAHYTMSPPQWMQYYMYAFERYQAFREIAPGEPAADSLPWYDDGVKALAERQHADGSWASAPVHHYLADTSFAVLFLLRSTKQSIQRTQSLDGGLLAGGRGLPVGAADVLLGPGGVRAKPLAGPAEQLLSIMEDPQNSDFAAAVEALETSFTNKQEELSQHAQKLRELTGTGSPEARAAVLRALARTRNLDEVPLLIEALNDSDPRVFGAAYDGLRFISRKFDGVGHATGEDEQTRQAAREQWKAWFQSIRPGFDFDE